jgi:hypothetical protein
VPLTQDFQDDPKDTALQVVYVRENDRDERRLLVMLTDRHPWWRRWLR